MPEFKKEMIPQFLLQNFVIFVMIVLMDMLFMDYDLVHSMRSSGIAIGILIAVEIFMYWWWKGFFRSVEKKES